MKIPSKRHNFIFIFFLALLSTLKAYAEKPVDIFITGVDKAIEQNIRASLSLAEPQASTLTKAHIERLHNLAQKEIFVAIQPFGYYTPTILAHLTEEQNRWIATYHINLGKPIIVSSRDLKIFGEGSNDPNLSTLFDAFLLNEGDICAHEPYEESKKTILTEAIHQGYIDASFEIHKIKVNLDTHQCDIILYLDTKQQYHFSSVSFSGSKLSNSFLQRFVPYQPGAPYSPDHILTLERDLEKSDYFRKVTLEGAIEPQNLDVPITVNLEDAKPNNYLFGIGYGTDTGIRGKVGWERRRINRFGHRFVTDFRLAEIYNRFQAQYIIPGKHPITDSTRILGRYIEDEFNEKYARINELELSETREIYSWQRILALTYKDETYQQFGSIHKEHSSLLLPSLTIGRVISDDPANPTHGKRIKLQLIGSWNVLVSDTNFIQADLEYKWVHRAGTNGKWILRTELGITLPDQVEKLPLSQRFYAGGDESIRGFAYRSLPQELDEKGNYHPVGGTYLGIMSLEYVQALTQNLGFALFTDAGGAFRNQHDDIQAGIGIGLRWKTPIGPIRFDVAKPLTNAAHSIRLHVAFGPEL